MGQATSQIPERSANDRLGENGRIVLWSSDDWQSIGLVFGKGRPPFRVILDRNQVITRRTEAFQSTNSGMYLLRAIIDINRS